MRLWSIHPKYLDKQGLLAVWREGLLAQSCLIKGEYSYCSECLGCGCIPLKYDLSEKAYLEAPKCEKCNGKGKFKTAYYNHPQLDRFKEYRKDIQINVIGQYLNEIWKEANRRGYNFNRDKIKNPVNVYLLNVTTGQLEYEYRHLYKKLLKRNRDKAETIWGWTHGLDNVLDINRIEPHPLFKIIEGDIESWEKVK